MEQDPVTDRTMQPPVTEDLWDARRLAQFLGCSPATVLTKNSRTPGDLPPRAAGKTPRWVPEVVRQWAKGNVGRPAPKRGRPRNHD